MGKCSLPGFLLSIFEFSEQFHRLSTYNGKEMVHPSEHFNILTGRGIFMPEPKMINPAGSFTRPGMPLSGTNASEEPVLAASVSDSSNCFKEAVCVDVSRVYDSCSDKDCLEDLPVRFTDQAQQYIDQAVNLKVRDASVAKVFLEVEPVAFNRGFYSVDMTFFFDICLSVYTAGCTQPMTVHGLSSFCKKVILYGSEGNVRVFRSDDPANSDCENTDMPRASVQTVDPIALSCKLTECPDHCECCAVPQCVASRYDGNFVQPGSKSVSVTLGLFTIVQLERQVQMLVPAYDFCIPDKECVSTTDDPCELFKKIKFPVDAFFPPRLSDLTDDTGSCGCCR